MYETAITSEDNELLGFTINVVQKQRQWELYLIDITDGHCWEKDIR